MPFLPVFSQMIEFPPEDSLCGCEGDGMKVGQGVNFPTTDAKDPNPLADWCQLTDEALY
jgi:hypothetical protein